MTVHTKRWTHLGLGVAIGGAMALSGCGQAVPNENTDAKVVAESTAPAAHTSEAGEGGEMGEMGAHVHDALPVEKRVAFMSGHVATGLALYRAGAPEQAAPHLLHPVSETHAAERAGIDALGFDGALFETVSEALNEGRPASEIGPQLEAAEANILLVQENAGGDARDIIAYLMDTVVEEYMIGVTDGVITDAGEYQDAYGFSVVALRIAREADLPSETLAELSALVDMWPNGGPLADSQPTPKSLVVAQTSTVHLSLSE